MYALLPKYIPGATLVQIVMVIAPRMAFRTSL